VGLLACHGGRSGSRSRTGLESRTGRSRARAVKRSRPHAGGSRRARLARGSRLRRCRRRILGVPPPSSLLPFPLPIPLSTDAMGIGLAGGVGAQLLIFTRAHHSALFPCERAAPLFPVRFSVLRRPPQRNRRLRLQPRGNAIRDEGAATATPCLESRSD
jgi:hypothetical protein